jgi:hypothetical protein
MVMSFKIISISVLCTLPGLLALSELGKTTVRHYIRGADGKVSSWETEVSTNDNGDYGMGIVWEGDKGLICGFCHTSGQNRQKEIYTVDRHHQIYFPRVTLQQADGGRLSWGPSGGYVTSRSGVLELYLKDGTPDLIAPKGSLVLNDRTGRPFVIYMPGVPTLQPKPR